MTAGLSNKWNRLVSKQPKTEARVNNMPTNSKPMDNHSTSYALTCQNCYRSYERHKKPTEHLCSLKCREQWRRKIEQMRAERPVTRRSTANNIADDLGEFYEPGDPGNPVRLKTWYLFIAEVFKLKDSIIARSLRKLVPLYKQDPTSDVIDKAIDQWIQLFHFPIPLIMTGTNICVSEFLFRLAIEILRYWARNERAAKRFEVPPRPA